MTAPDAAVASAAQIIHRLACGADCVGKPGTVRVRDRAAAEAVLQAAAPAIAAAERDRIRLLALTQASAPLAVQSPVASQALREFADLMIPAMTCDASMGWHAAGDGILIACGKAGHPADPAHQGLHSNGVTQVTWDERDRRNFHGEFPGWCQRTAGCVLPAGHRTDGSGCAT